MLPQFTLARYQRLWWVGLLSISVPALALTLCVSPGPCLVVGGIGAGVYVGSLILGYGFAGQQWRAAAVGTLLLLAAVPVLGWTALPLVLLAAASSPPVARRLMRTSGTRHLRRTAHRSRDNGLDSASEVAECLEAMSAAELCQLWGTSFSLVKSPTRLSERVVGAGLRLSLLDELERRDREGFTSWLARHPSPASEPRWVLPQARDDDGQGPAAGEAPSPAGDS